MACGVTTTLAGQTITCDNTGTSSHAGEHAGPLVSSLVVFGFTWTTSVRVKWLAGVSVANKQKTAVLGESDFV